MSDYTGRHIVIFLLVIFSIVLMAFAVIFGTVGARIAPADKMSAKEVVSPVIILPAGEKLVGMYGNYGKVVTRPMNVGEQPQRYKVWVLERGDTRVLFEICEVESVEEFLKGNSKPAEAPAVK